MTELEQRIYNEVAEQPPKLIKEVSQQESKHRYIQLPILIEGIMDIITKDTKNNTYTLEYKYTKDGSDIENKNLDVTKIFTK